MTIEATPVTTEQQLAAAESMIALLQEDFADLGLSAEDRGWRTMSTELDREFSRDGLDAITRNCAVMAIASPIIKRGLLLRIGYIWGQGVEVAARAGESAPQDVNAVVKAFWDDPANQAAFTSAQAQEENERALGVDGNFFLAFFPNPLNGATTVRSVPFAEVRDVILNPEDRDDPWFYLRTYSAQIAEPGYAPGSTRLRRETRRVLHPAVGFRPKLRPKTIDGVPVQWDQPILHVAVNRLDGMKFGVPDVYAALPWARAYEGFLTDWAQLVKALSKFAWRLTGDRASKARRAAQTLAAALPSAAGLPGTASDAGQVAAYGPGASLEAIPKTGATIDSDSGRPLAAMAAAGLGLPVTMLLADPGTTGARAVAETLDRPLIQEMNARRTLWGAVISTVLDYVVDQSVRAPRGALRGTVVLDTFTRREVVTLAGDVERTLEVDWPPIDKMDPLKLVTALVEASGTEVLPKPWLLKALLKALGEKDVDEIVDALTDDEGNWIDPDANAGDAAVQAFRRGDDPARVVDREEVDDEDEA